MPRIFLSGDCHASFAKLGFKAFPESRTLTKDDFVIICGDFGYWEESKRQEYWMDWLEERPFTTLWVDGNHENFDLLKALPVKQWHGGTVQFVRPSVIHLMRGQVYEIGKKRFFTFGGARSSDVSGGILEAGDPDLKAKIRELEVRGEPYRINHRTWWKEEMPDEEEMETGLAALKAVGWKVDYIITHCCATRPQKENMESVYKSNALTDYLLGIREKCSFTHWFFGHYHEDRDWSCKETCLYQRIVELKENGYEVQDISERFSCRDRVQFITEGVHGKEQYAGRILHINHAGSGSSFCKQPTANILSDDGLLYKNIPYADMRKPDKEA